jgi:hypothetical protein
VTHKTTTLPSSTSTSTLALSLALASRSPNVVRAPHQSIHLKVKQTVCHKKIVYILLQFLDTVSNVRVKNVHDLYLVQSETKFFNQTSDDRLGLGRRRRRRRRRDGSHVGRSSIRTAVHAQGMYERRGRRRRRAEVNELKWMCAGFVHAFDPPTSNV